MPLEIFRNFVPLSELLSAIVGTIYFYKYKHTHLKYFLFLLWYITLTEFTGWYASENQVLGYFDSQGRLYTLWMYNLLRFITLNTMFYIYYKSFYSKPFKKWVKIFVFVYSVAYFINWLFLQSFIYEKSKIPRILGSIFLIITIIFYFIELLKSEKMITFHRFLLFWISVGLLLFYAGTIPFSIKWNTYMLFPGIHKLFSIVWTLAIIMYLTFTFGFIWSNKEEKIE